MVVDTLVNEFMHYVGMKDKDNAKVKAKKIANNLTRAINTALYIGDEDDYNSLGRELDEKMNTFAGILN